LAQALYACSLRGSLRDMREGLYLRLWILSMALYPLHQCGADFLQAYEQLMGPVSEITSNNKNCSWGFQPDLPTIAKASSEFEDMIEIKVDDCGFYTLLMDGFVQSHAADEHIYHEMLVHPAMMAFAAMNRRAPARVFLGGSGEGAGAREALRWRSVQNVTMVDIDQSVTKLTLDWMPQMSNNSFDDPRLNVLTGDAIRYLEDMSDGETFDVLVLDFPDPFESNDLVALYARSVYELCRSRMHEGSVLVTQSGPCSGFDRRGELVDCEVVESLILKNIATAFEHVDVMQHPMATWKPDADEASSWSSLTFGTIGRGGASLRGGEDVGVNGVGIDSPLALVPASTDDWISREIGFGVLRYYDGGMHRAAWAKPLAFKERLLAIVGKARQHAPRFNSAGFSEALRQAARKSEEL